jgi:putative membrane protein
LNASALLTFVRGFCMGAADIVPGVSGGTVALVLGIYERLLDNVRRGARAIGAVLKADPSGVARHLASVEWGFLLPLLAGVGTALAVLASVIEGLLETNPEEMAGLFFGLVAGSIVVAWLLLRDRTPSDLAVMAAVGAATFLLLGFQSGPVADPSPLAFFGAGAVAICAMILPGISGSFLLLMLGMYAAVLGAVHDRTASDLASLALFIAGAVVGLALFSTALGWLLDRYHNRVLAVLIGLMVGSFRVLWPWPNGVGIISEVEGESIPGTGLDWPASADLLWPTVLAVGAFLLVLATTRLATSTGGTIPGSTDAGRTTPTDPRHSSHR